MIAWWCASTGWGKRLRIAAAAHAGLPVTALSCWGDDWPLTREGVDVVRARRPCDLAGLAAALDPDVLVMDAAPLGWRGEMRDVVETRARAGRRNVFVWRHRPELGHPDQWQHLFGRVVAVEPGCPAPHTTAWPVLVRDHDELPDPHRQRARLGVPAGEPLAVVVPSVWDDRLPHRVRRAAPPWLHVQVLDPHYHWPAIEWLAAADCVVANAGQVTWECAALGVPAVLTAGAGQRDQPARANTTWDRLGAALAAIRARSELTVPPFANRAARLAELIAHP